MCVKQRYVNIRKKRIQVEGLWVLRTRQNGKLSALNPFSFLFLDDQTIILRRITTPDADAPFDIGIHARVG